MEETQVPPKVTALILSYNNVDPIRRCVEALERTTPRETLEILVVDCGSRDGSADVDTEYPGVTAMRLPRNFGATKALNIGMRTAKGEFVFFLDAEVEVQPETVRKLAERLESDEDATAVCPLLMDEEGEPASRLEELPTAASTAAVWKRGEHPASAEVQMEAGSQDVLYPGRAALMVRKRFIEGMNYLDPRYGEYWADADLCIQICRAHKKIRLLPGVHVVLHPREMPVEKYPAAARALLSADCANGAAGLIAKHYGSLAATKFRLGAICWALGRALGGLLTVRDAGFEVGRFKALISGQKVDGSQYAL